MKTHTSKIFITLLVALVTFSLKAHAQSQDLAASLSGEQLVLIARAAVIDEVTVFNSSLADGTDLDGYRSRMIEYFQDSGKNSIDPTYVSDKCIFSEDNLANLFSDQLSSGDDALSMKKNALATVKSMYGPKIWQLVSAICIHAKDRFVDRLRNGAKNGVPLSMTDDLIDGFARLVFYPTDHGKPSFKKSIDSAFSALLSGAMVVGATGALVGIPVGGVALVVITLAMGARSTGAVLVGQGRPFMPQLKRYDSMKLPELQIDLTTTELSLIASERHP